VADLRISPARQAAGQGGDEVLSGTAGRAERARRKQQAAWEDDMSSRLAVDLALKLEPVQQMTLAVLYSS